MPPTAATPASAAIRGVALPRFFLSVLGIVVIGLLRVLRLRAGAPKGRGTRVLNPKPAGCRPIDAPVGRGGRMPAPDRGCPVGAGRRPVRV
jgi:hypothetical protein